MKIPASKDFFTLPQNTNILPAVLVEAEPSPLLKENNPFLAHQPDGFPEPQKTSTVNELAYSFVVGKLRSGQELTSYELSLLKKKDPSLYAKAVKAQKARIELRRRLESAKTKKEFDNARANAINKAASSIDVSGSVSPSCSVSGSASLPCTDVGLSQFSISSSALQNETGNFYGKRHRLQTEEALQKK